MTFGVVTPYLRAMLAPLATVTIATTAAMMMMMMTLGKQRYRKLAAVPTAKTH
jgi:hypothetical protein